MSVPIKWSWFKKLGVKQKYYPITHEKAIIMESGRKLSDGLTSLEESISDAWDEETEYSVGDYFIYKDQLYKVTGSGMEAGTIDGTKILPVSLAKELKGLGVNGAGRANAVFYEHNLGTSFTEEHSEDIRSGRFDKVRVGCYWIINGRKYWAAHADYLFNTRYEESFLVTHHMLVIPDDVLDWISMNDTSTTNGSYAGSKLGTSAINTAYNIIKDDFGYDHILIHGELLAGTTTNGVSSGWGWSMRSCVLMNDQMVFGHLGAGVPSVFDIGICRSQLALFQHRPDLIGIRKEYWLRNVCNNNYFSAVSNYGNPNRYDANANAGVRPYFLLY